MRKLMNITKPLLCRNRHRFPFHLDTLCDFCVYAGCLLLFVCIVPLVLTAAETEIETPTPSADGVASATENSVQAAEGTENANGASAAEPTTETITGTSKRMERFEKEGITILIDEAKTIRYDEQGVEVGFLNADKITLKADPETGTTTEVIAVGNVEIRDQDIFATCDHAIMNNLTNTVVLKENVVVLQEKDRLETKLFTFNRTTGRQTGEGGVKFKVTVTQAAPVAAEASEDAEGDASTDEEGASTDTSDQTDADTETSNTDGTTEEELPVDAEDAESADAAEETDAD
ncbi:hypothetical protein F4Y59_05765 [Candidatus Poribacteria bacterium]|nr:hypothetical protein [Candidatus Poribacteria bacterium]MYK16751.1 hypothetical protein [Candidatus Poribacteria bacterium]